MTDLYASLGLGREATAAEVQRAYRKAAKQAHPDTGGSAEEFQALRRAAVVLCDPKLRKHYDETGEIEDKPVDNAQAEALNLVAAAIEQILATCDQRRLDPTEIDIVADAQKIIHARCAEIGTALRKPKAQLATAKKLLGRFTRKDGLPNMLEPVMAARVSQFQQQIAVLEKQLTCAENALTLISDYSFDWRAPAQTPSPYGVPNTFTSFVQGL